MRAALLALVAACGDGIALPDDGGALDASDRGLVRIHVVQSPKPPFGRGLVYFQERDSTISLVTRVDALGNASGYVGPGAFVTFVEELTTGPRAMFTYAGVNPGDELVIGQPSLVDDRAFVRVRIPPTPAFTSFSVTMTCGSVSGPMITSPLGNEAILVNCGGRTEAFVTGARMPPEVPLYGYHADIALDPPPAINRLELPPPDTARGIVRVHVANMPADQQIGIFHALVVGEARPFDTPVSVSASTDWTWDFDLPVFPDATVRTILNDGDEILVDWGPAKSSFTYDHAELQLPTQTAPASYEPTTRSVIWAEDADAEVAQWTRATLRWSYGTEFFRWEVLGPRRDEARLALPTLPSDVLVPNPATLFLDQVVRLRVSETARAPLKRLLNAWTGEWPITGETGRVVYDQLGL